MGKGHSHGRYAWFGALAFALVARMGRGEPSLPVPAQRPETGQGPLINWRLVWADEFDKPGPADPGKWGYEKGFVRNHEEQYYTVARQENARVENGRLVIEARKEAYKTPDGKTARYTSASLTTEKTFSIAYGRIEVRAKLPRGRGMWPAIWMLGNSHHRIGWPKCGEIDIMEVVGHDEGSVHATVHWFDLAKNKKGIKGAALRGQTPYADFHIYALEWFPDRMDFFYDNRKYLSFPLSEAGTEAAGNPFHKPYYLLLNLAVGGSWGGKKGIDDTCFPQRYEIDYVRIYQRIPNPDADRQATVGEKCNGLGKTFLPGFGASGSLRPAAHIFGIAAESIRLDGTDGSVS